MHPSSPPWLVVAFAVFALGIASGAVVLTARVRPQWRARARIAIAMWLAATSGLAFSGALAHFDARPPPFAGLLVVAMGCALVVALSPVGRALAELPLWLLVAVQGFRLPLELLMHEAARAGVMPRVMSFGAGGHNYDILAGGLALVVGIALKRGAPRQMAVAWVAFAFVTLLNVVVVAVRATPLFLAYGEDQVNTWVAYWPFVWLPTVMVVAALAGQIVVVRALRAPKGKESR